MDKHEKEPIGRVGKLLRSQRHQRGLGMREVARRAGLGTACLSKIERGGALPGPRMVAKIERVLGITGGRIAEVVVLEVKGRWLLKYLGERDRLWKRGERACTDGTGNASKS